MIRISMLIGALLLTAESGAQTAQVDFTGNLLATTCAVSVNGSGTANGVVQLADVPANRLATAGAREGRRTWAVQVGNAGNRCLAQRVQLGFRNAGNVNPQGRLRNTGTARNVDVLIGRVDGSVADINLSTNANSQVRDIPVATGVAVLTYSAEYFATAVATVGSVVTSVQFDLIYP